MLADLWLHGHLKVRRDDVAEWSYWLLLNELRSYLLLLEAHRNWILSYDVVNWLVVDWEEVRWLLVDEIRLN